MDEKKLVNLAQKGDEEALAALFHNHYSMLLKYLTKVTLDFTLAEDLAQETMLKVIEKIHLYNGQSKFSSWMITIATRLYIDKLRRLKREKAWLRQQSTAIRKLNWHAGQHQEILPDVIEALDQLSPETRSLIILKHYYGYLYEDLSSMLRIPQGTVKSKIHAGLKQIRKELKRDEKGARS